jgi:hypothetical protein
MLVLAPMPGRAPSFWLLRDFSDEAISRSFQISQNWIATLPAIYQGASRPWSSLVPVALPFRNKAMTFFQELPGLMPNSTLTNELSCMNIDVSPSIWLHSVAAWRSSDVATAI